MITEKIKKTFFVCLFLIMPVFLYPQTGQRIEALLSSNALTYGQVTQFVLEAADIPAFSSPEAALRFAVEQNWLPRNVVANDPAKLRGLSLLIMKAFEVRGGIFYSLFQTSHYAYRELVYRNIIVGRAGPDMVVSGDTLLYLVSRVLSFQESNIL